MFKVPRRASKSEESSVGRNWDGNRVWATFPKVFASRSCEFALWRHSTARTKVFEVVRGGHNGRGDRYVRRGQANTSRSTGTDLSFGSLSLQLSNTDVEAAIRFSWVINFRLFHHSAELSHRQFQKVTPLANHLEVQFQTGTTPLIW